MTYQGKLEDEDNWGEYEFRIFLHLFTNLDKFLSIDIRSHRLQATKQS